MAHLKRIPAAMRKFPRRKKRFWAALIAIVLILVIARILYVRKQANERASSPAASVQSAQAALDTITNTVDGSGTLEAAETVDVTIPTGITIQSVLVESGDAVTKGQKLAKLDKTSITSALVEIEASILSIEDQLDDDDDLSDLEIENLENQLAELESEQEELEELYENPVITATAAGIIASVNVSADSEVSQNTGSSNASESSASEMAASSTSSASLVLLSNTSSATDTDTSTVMAQLAEQVDAEEETFDDSASVEETSDAVAAETLTTIAFSNFYIEQPVLGESLQTAVSDTTSYTGTISWSPDDSTAQAATAYTATVVLTAKSGYVFSSSESPSQQSSTTDWKVVVSDSGETMTITAQFSKTAEASASDNDTGTASSGTDNSTSSGTTGNSNASATDSTGSSGSSSQASGQTSSAASSSSGGTTGTSSSSSDTTGSGTTSASYSQSEATAFTIQTQEDVLVSISVDELDILSVAEGQTAVITLDAIEGEEFEGTITNVSNTASSSSSSAKYTVEITLPMEDDMRLGMTASATIEVESAENVVTIPMTALQERGDDIFVYTEQDADGNLSGETVVETGLSNGTTVEITSGLSEGDTVYYTRTDSEDADSSSDFFGGGGEMPSGDGMPSDNGGGNGGRDGGGGDMPSGGPGGGM